MRSKRLWTWYVVALVVADAALLGLASVAAGVLRARLGGLPGVAEFEPDLRWYGLVAVGVIPGLLVILWLRRAYARHILLGGPEEYARVVSGCTYGTLLVVATGYVYGPVLTRGWLLLFWLLAIGLVGAGRFTLRRAAYHLRHRGWFIRRVLIAGVGDQGLAIAQQLHGPLRQGNRVVGILDDYLAAGTRLASARPAEHGESPAEFLVLGHPREAQAIAAKHECDLLVVVPAALSWESQQGLARLGSTPLNGLELRLAPTQYDLTAVGVEPAPLGYIPLLRLQPARIVGVQALIRAGVDLTLTLLLLAALAPGLIWAIVSARWRGVRPVFVHRQVLGLGGVPVTFSLLNLDVSGSLLLHGVPALFAVLRGHLGLVGPRPLAVDEEQPEYQRWAGVLLAVKPGLTGPWRLASPTGSPVEQVLADVWWVRNWSIWQDLFILFQTARRAWSAPRREHGLVRWDNGTPQPGLPALQH